MWNGLLVAFVGMQPIIATLDPDGGRPWRRAIADAAARSSRSAHRAICSWVAAIWLGVPCSVWIATVAVLATALLIEGTALGLFIRAIGVNPVATRLVGLRSRAHRIRACMASPD